MPIPLSVLDLCPIPEGGTAANALANSADLARHVEGLGFNRYWLAEHHNMPGIASAATAVVIGHVAAATKTIRVGAGGIMLPNHAPLQVAEAFGTLATLFPGRIDLGLGRAPGTDMATARALRRHMQASDRFPQDVTELLNYFATPDPDARVRAIPGEGTEVPVWILGSSLYGAQFAAWAGLPYAFASHFAPAMLEEAVHIYRSTFQPSAWAEKPYFMLAAGLAAAETDAEAAHLRSSQLLAFARLRLGRPGKLPRPTTDLSEIPDGMRREIEAALSCAVVGGPAQIKAGLRALIDRYRPDEIMLTGNIHDTVARKQGFSIAAEAMRALD